MGGILPAWLKHDRPAPAPWPKLPFLRGEPLPLAIVGRPDLVAYNLQRSLARKCAELFALALVGAARCLDAR